MGADGGRCLPNGSCGAGLVCVEGVCEPGTAPVTGVEGAPCHPDNRCDGELQCQDDLCVDSSPGAGSRGGPCHEDGSCDPGLECLNGQECKTAERAELGSEGGPCFENGTCLRGLDCDQERICVDNGGVREQAVADFCERLCAMLAASCEDSAFGTACPPSCVDALDGVELDVELPICIENRATREPACSLPAASIALCLEDR